MPAGPVVGSAPCDTGASLQSASLVEYLLLSCASCSVTSLPQVLVLISQTLTFFSSQSSCFVEYFFVSSASFLVTSFQVLVLISHTLALPSSTTSNCFLQLAAVISCSLPSILAVKIASTVYLPAVVWVNSNLLLVDSSRLTSLPWASRTTKVTLLMVAFST